MREKIDRTDIRNVVYDEKHWSLLSELRRRACEISEVLKNHGFGSFVYGSVARGDVHLQSDIDIVVLRPTSIFLLEFILEENFNIYSREIIQATPNSALKGYISIDERVTISFPITKLTTTEYEFYYFGGLLDSIYLKDIKHRVAGVNKRLKLILPTQQGHIEYSIFGREEEVAKILNISIMTVKERIRVLSKRDEKGRTGVFIRYALAPHESFSEVIKKLSDKNPLVRNLIKRRGLIA